jgi:hypothetical protein
MTMKARSGGSTELHRAPGAIPDERDRCPTVLYFEAEFVKRRACPLEGDGENHEVRFDCQKETDHEEIRHNGMTDRVTWATRLGSADRAPCTQ